MTEEIYEILDLIENSILEIDSEKESSSVLEDIGYMTEKRRKELNLRNDAYESLQEIKKYFNNQRTLSSEKTNQLISIIDKFFVENNQSLFVINTILPFRLQYLP